MRLLLGLLLRGLLLALLEHLLCGLGHHARERHLDLRGQLLVCWGQGHTKLLLNLLAVTKPNVLGNMRLHGRLDHWCLGVLANQLHDYGVLHGHRVHLDVRLVVLVEECLEWFALERGHVLCHRVFGFLIVRQGHELVCVLDAKHLQHLAVQLGQVVDVRGHLCHLDDRLVLHNPLAHSGRVGVAHRDDVNVFVILLLGAAVGFVWVVVILGVCVVPNQPGQKLQFLFETVVQPGLNSGHHFQLALKDGQGCAHGRLCAHV